MTLPFYRAFEDRYRGSRELIKSRLAVYLPFISPLQSLYANCTALDVGCGRGEWLELLLEQGFDPQGVDLDEGMLATCLEMQLPAVLGDALVALQNLPDESLTIVSGFHIAEHIPFESLQTLVSEALRVLKPAGLLILETPNAENITVGAHTFYMDPTHEKPIPSSLLSFLTEYSGFARNKVLRLQETERIIQAEKLNLMDVLEGASPDYAVIAQKAAPASQLVLFDRAFNKSYGIALDKLAGRYQLDINGQFAALEGHINGLQQQQQLLVQLQHELAAAHEAELQAAFNSKSWRLTKPLRLAMQGLRQTKSKAVPMLKSIVKRSLQKSIALVLARPAWRTKLNKKIQQYPKLYSRLLRFAANQGLIASRSNTGSHKNQGVPNTFDSLTPHAQHIYTELKQTVKKQNKEKNHKE